MRGADSMRAIVVGCGSIGKRRALILHKLGLDVYVTDTNARRKAWALKHDLGWLSSTQWWGEAEGALVLICTPPETHFEIAAYTIDTAPAGIFIEKPLAVVAGVEWAAVVEETERRGIVTMGACNLRFVQHIEDLTVHEASDPLLVFRMGQHEKHWSKGHQKQTMILDSIHELDLAMSMQGPIDKLLGWSDLDEAEVWVFHEGGRQSKIVLDRKTDPPVRHVATGTGRILADMSTPDPGMYVRELEHFVAAVYGDHATCNPLAQALDTLHWARFAVQQG